MDRFRILVETLMGRLGFVPQERLDATENERRVIQAHARETERRLTRKREELQQARQECRHYRREMDKVFALRSDLSGYFKVSAYNPSEIEAVPVVELRITPLQHAIRVFAMDHRLMKARPEDYARMWSKEIARQLEPKLADAVLDGLRRI